MLERDGDPFKFEVSMPVTAHQVAFFRQSGYLRLPARLSPDSSQILRKRLEEDMVQHGREDRGGRRVDRIVERSEIWWRLATHEVLLDMLEPLLGPNILFLSNRHNHGTWTLAGRDHRLHRDVLQWSRTALSVIVYLEDAPVEGGCTRVVPGSQFLPFVGMPNNGGTWMDEHSIYRDLIGQAAALPMRVGEMLMFDSVCFHSAGENRTSSRRAAVSFAYVASDELARAPIDGRILVRGEDLYRGNDRPI